MAGAALKNPTNESEAIENTSAPVIKIKLASRLRR
jgi:hypothetical protein